MDAVLRSLFDGIVQAGIIWAILVLFGLLAIAVLAWRSWLPEPVSVGLDTVAPGAVLKETRLANRATELDEHATKLVGNADYTAEIAASRRKEWLAALNEVEVAWTAYNTGHDEVSRLSAAAALPVPRSSRTPAEYAFRERYLRRTAMLACSRRQLSALELSDVLAHRNGWDPKRHPVEQELALSRVTRDGLFSAYQVAVQRERAAWEAAEVAAVAARNTRDEARLAMDEAWQMRRLMRHSPQRGGHHWGIMKFGIDIESKLS